MKRHTLWARISELIGSVSLIVLLAGVMGGVTGVAYADDEEEPEPAVTCTDKADLPPGQFCGCKYHPQDGWLWDEVCDNCEEAGCRCYGDLNFDPPAPTCLRPGNPPGGGGGGGEN